MPRFSSVVALLAVAACKSEGGGDATPAPAPSASTASTPSTPYVDPYRSCRRDPERSVEAAVVAPLIGAKPPASPGFGVIIAETDAGVVRWRAFGVGPNTVLARLGFENGDRIEGINGFALNDLGRLQTADMLSVLLTRRGISMCIELQVVR